MTVFAFFASAIAAFLFGFLLGTMGFSRNKTIKKSRSAEDEAIEKLRREYSNFLSYDGTEQSDR